ncbi:hypothetical protein LSH36_75g12086 [Paralvinella palmiformis]|uniref:RRP12-like protein n=1 Tax=Paralvinella palmiformis TaxID=53620 RepID=A0AAD9K2J5_9ANNE|nr:hypothetical protein LSH36_75g12086 [Paralvinella palmiformis]
MRAPAKTPKHGRRWKKGHSCVSNPGVKKHRSAAKNRFFSVVSGPSSLTVDALAKHDARQEDKDGDAILQDVSETQSASGRTFSTWASNWTECTNVTFNKVHRYVTTSSVMHKSILAVLAAITEVIKTEDGKETDTEYFAALMTALDNPANDAETVAAITYLLAMCMKRVPAGVLKAKFSDASKLFMNLLAAHINTQLPTLLRSVLRCLAHLLRVQDQAAWSNASTVHVYNAILSFVTHSKPKVRKAGQQAVVSILRGSKFMLEPSAPSHHPAAVVTVKYCVKEIETTGGSSEATTTLHVLGLLQEILDIVPKSSLKSACETILKVMTLANVLVTSVSMKCLHKMFASRPKPTSLPADLNAQIISALYDFVPGENDTQLMSAWLSVMKEAHANLQSNLNDDLFVNRVPRYFAVAMNCLKNNNLDIGRVATQAMISLVRDKMGGLHERFSVMVNDTATPIHKIIRVIENGLSYQYHATWGMVLELLAVVMEVLGKSCHPILMKCLRSLADLRDSHRFPYKSLLDKAVGMAVQSMGPKLVLDAIPLQITGDLDNYDFPHSWLLPLLREYIKETELSFFTKFFLPLAAKLQMRSLEFASDGQVVQAKTYDTLQLQIWSLLPGFCNKPTDLTESFKSIAKVLGVGLREREDIRMDILASIRKLILQNLENEACRKEMARFAKNFLPIFFNLYTSDPEKERDPVRMAMLETIRIYVKITDQELVGSYVDMCLEKSSEENVSAFRRYALLDLLISLVQQTDLKRLKKIYVVALLQLNTNDRTVQKKSYRILEQLCSGESHDCKLFVTSHVSELAENLTTSLSGASPSAKAPRLRCLIHIFRQLDDEEMEFLQNVVPEAVLCTKEVAEKARQAAYLLLIEIGKALFRWNPNLPKAAVVQVYFELVLAGLAGQPHVIACTLLTLTRITYEFKDYVNDELLGILVDSACLLLSCNAREIVRSALTFLKLLLTQFDEVTIGQYLEKMVSSLVLMKETNRHQVRFKAKEIFSRLVRKFGYEVILSQLPASHHKLLSHIKKVQERAKRKQQRKIEDDDDDDAEDDDVPVPKNKPESFEEFLPDTDSDLDDEQPKKKRSGRKVKDIKGRAQQGAAWLQEGSEDVMDFLDPSVSHKVLSVKPNPKEQKKNNKDTPFKLASDGRMIIQESDDECDAKGKSAPPVDDLDELLDAFEGHSKKSRKRKLSIDDPDEDELTNRKYQAGGSGIHRPVKKPVPGAEYRAKKAHGDIKKKGQPDPYAYIPLELSALNKRKKAKVKGQFKSLVRGAKKGALKGQKLRAKQKQKR